MSSLARSGASGENALQFAPGKRDRARVTVGTVALGSPCASAMTVAASGSSSLHAARSSTSRSNVSSPNRAATKSALVTSRPSGTSVPATQADIRAKATSTGWSSSSVVM